MRCIALMLLLLAAPGYPSAAPAWGKTLTWSFSSDLQTLDPHVSRVSFTNAFLANIYETLVRMEDRLAIEPALAVAWEQPSPTIWRFRLRPGVRFHNGDAFTADDVLFSWTRLNTPGANRGAMTAATAGGLNSGRYSNPAVDALIERVAEETDPAARAAAVHEAFRIEKEDVGHIPLHQQPLTWAARKGIELHQAPDNMLRLWLVRID